MPSRLKSDVPIVAPTQSAVVPAPGKLSPWLPIWRAVALTWPFRSVPGYSHSPGRLAGPTAMKSGIPSPVTSPYGSGTGRSAAQKEYRVVGPGFPAASIAYTYRTLLPSRCGVRTTLVGAPPLSARMRAPPGVGPGALGGKTGGRPLRLYRYSAGSSVPTGGVKVKVPGVRTVAVAPSSGYVAEVTTGAAGRNPS